MSNGQLTTVLTEVVQPDCADDLTCREMMRILDPELESLPENLRAPLVLCYLQGKTRDEAAVELGLDDADV